jgi:hypothetical protein
MKKFIFSVLIIAIAVSAAISQEKPWAQWTKTEAEKVLNHSGWGQTQTETDTSEMFFSPTTQGGTSTPTGRVNQTDRQTVNNSRVAQGANNQAIAVNYRVRLLSARPVRQAFMRVIELAQQKPDEELLSGLRAFVERDFKDFIVVAVAFDSTDGRYSGPPLQAFGSATVGTLKNKTYLERKHGKRLFLLEYQAPINDGLGAKFIFPRLVDETKFLKEDSGSVRFYSEVNNQIKLNVTFRMSEMLYNGKLEY